jgi:hypothetical protein
VSERFDHTRGVCPVAVGAARPLSQRRDSEPSIRNGISIHPILQLPRQHRNLQHQHRRACGRNSQKPLRDPCDKASFVAHLNAPLSEFIEQFSL